MKSVISLSMHKAGSSIADLLITEICKSADFQIDRIATQVPGSPLSERDLFIQYQEHMKPNEGIYYGIARGPYVRDMPIIKDLRTIIQVRDPRDCLTSAYFSHSQSHVPPTDPKKLAEFNAFRERLQSMSIDQYVLEKAADYKQRMEILRDILRDHPNCLLIKYEAMVTEPKVWRDRILDFLGVELTDELQERLSEKMDFDVKREDTSKHKRQVTPGDHARKLTNETIMSLNKTLGPEMRFFDYDV